MRNLFMLMLITAVVIGGGWLFTSEQSPFVTALGMGLDGEFKSESYGQVDSLVAMRESANRDAQNRPNRHQWSGRYRESHAKKLMNDPDFDAEGIVTYMVVRGDGYGSLCTDTFKRNRSSRKWELVSDPGAEERQRLNQPSVAQQEPQRGEKQEKQTTDASLELKNDPHYQNLRALWVKFADAQVEATSIQESFRETSDLYDTTIKQAQTVGGVTEEELHRLIDQAEDLKKKCDAAANRCISLLNQIETEDKRNHALVMKVANDLLHDDQITPQQKEAIRSPIR